MSMAPRGYESFSTLNPQQNQGFNQLIQMLRGQLGQSQGLFSQGSNYLQNLLSGSPESTQAFEAPAMRQFNQQIIPGIAERFAGQGGLSSSGFQNALGSAGADLSERLAALRGGLQNQAAGQALGYAQQPQSNLQNLLGMNTQGIAPEQMSFLQQLLVALSGGAGQGLGGLGSLAIGKLF